MMYDAVFLRWLAERLVNVYKVPEETDFVLKLRRIADTIDKTNFNQAS